MHLKLMDLSSLTCTLSMISQLLGEIANFALDEFLLLTHEGFLLITNHISEFILVKLNVLEEPVVSCDEAVVLLS